jgi:hypothetical protein
MATKKGLIVHEKLSFAELRSLRAIASGETTKLPAQELVKFEKLGFVERKFGGIVLTALGRYQIDVRARETGLPLLANRWRRRAEELRVIAETMNTDADDQLHKVADQWVEMADQVEKLAALEKKSPSLT